MTVQASIRDSSEAGEQSSLRFDCASIQEENLGCVNFSLYYDPEQSLLTVRLIQVRCRVSYHGIMPCRQPSVSRVAQQTGPRQATLLHNIVKAAYSWSATSDASPAN